VTFSKPENADAKEDSATERRVSELSRAHSNQTMRDQPGSVEFSGFLETATPLEAPKTVQTALPRQPAPAAPSLSPAPVPPPSTAQPLQVALSTDAPPQQVAQPTSTSIATTEKITLLEERLVIDQRRQKVGEVIVRKEIETRFIQVPVRREKLIVEQISPEHKQLAVIDLGQHESEVDANAAFNTSLSPVLRGEFNSVKAAIQFLEAIAAHSGADSQKVQLGVVLEDAAMQATAQRWLEQYAAQKAATTPS